MQKGKGQKLEDLFKDNYLFLAAVAYSIVESKEAAKDIVQDFFVWYCQKENDLSIKGTFKSYATKAIKNLSFQYVQKKKRKQDFLKKIDVNESENPLVVENKNFNETTLRKLLKRLPEARRKIFVSHIVYDMSYSEIAKENNISINTVKTQMKRAYAFFRSNMIYLICCAFKLDLL